jgi:broad-specificity NMP kinase
MDPSIIIFSGLPGTGKNTLARWLAIELNIPLLRIDDIVETYADPIPEHNGAFWSKMIAILLENVEAQSSRSQA